MNHVKEILQSGKTAIGTTASPNSETRFLAGAGFDFLLFDTQHSPVEIKQLGAAIGAMRGRTASPIVRVGENRADQICYALDVGARGIIVPMVNSADEAHDVVSFCRYPFAGVRSSAGMRGEWGEFKDYRAYMDAVNEQLVILPMIETQEAMDNLDEIVKVPGVDVVLVGPSDLSINLGVPLDYTSTTYKDALTRIGSTCQDAGIAAGMFFVPPGITPATLVDLGFRFFTMPWEGWASRGVTDGIAALRTER
ncbi:MAG: aldolase/citrate lyase family protein [Gammaproteobacteria bacterium]|nr:aldolase/citrate lyase family protein [Gammaproteobacteria bacterium]